MLVFVPCCKQKAFEADLDYNPDSESKYQIYEF